MMFAVVMVWKGHHPSLKTGGDPSAHIMTTVSSDSKLICTLFTLHLWP